MAHQRILDEREQAIYYSARERRRSLAGFPEMHRTHEIFGVTVMEVASITTTAVFPDRSAPVTFRTTIRITADGSVATEHRGVVFEFGGTGRSATLFVGDQTIGWLSGGASGSGDVATALFDDGSELKAGREFDITVSAIPGDGRVRIWGNGKELARATNANGTMNGDWADGGAGTFAALPGSFHPDIPAASQSGPDGFEVIAPLSVFIGQMPRRFF